MTDSIFIKAMVPNVPCVCPEDERILFMVMHKKDCPGSEIALVKQLTNM